jgi:F-type H+-transporting ATPase subunit b
MFLSFDGTFFVQLINFAIFFAILNVVFIRPVGKAIAKRREYINSVTSDYERYQAQAASLKAQADNVRAAARREAEAELARARAQASNEAAALSTEYGARVSRAVEEANKTVAGEMEAARKQEPELAAQLASLVVERTLTEAAS